MSTTFFSRALRVAGVMAAATTLASATTAGATTIAAVTSPTTDYATAKAHETAFLAGLSAGSHVVTETFDSVAFTASGSNMVSIDTSVGTFKQVRRGRTRDGLRVLDKATSHVTGRRDMTTADTGTGNWLDSNDSRIVDWIFAEASNVSQVGFFLTDVADVSGKLTATFSDGVTESVSLSSAGHRLANANMVYVTADFGTNFATKISFVVNTCNDGWGIDNVTTVTADSSATSPVPLPAGAVLLLTGLGGLAAARRRKSA